MKATKEKSTETKFIGAQVPDEFYWELREKTIQKRISITDAIVCGLVKLLDLKDPSNNK